MSPLQDTGVFIIQVLFGLYILLVMLRLMLQMVQADFYNPVSQVILKSTQPVLRPMRRYVPSMSSIDTSSVLLLFVLKFLELWLVTAIAGISADLGAIAVLAFARLLELAIYIMMFSIFVVVVLSWIQPHAHNPAISLMNALSGPIMRPARQLIPPIGGLDLSPLIALLVLGSVLRLIVSPIAYLSGLAPPL